MSRSLVGLVLLGMLTFAAPASANEARLWACHGPAGQALGAQPFFQATVGDAALGGGCAMPGTALTARFTVDNATGQSQGLHLLDVPAGLELSGVILDRKAEGPGYIAKTNAGVLESNPAAVDGSATFAATGTRLTVGLLCDAGLGQSCGGSSAAGLDLRSATLIVKDETQPKLAIGGYRNPAQGTLDLEYVASDVGIGLGTASAAIDGTPVATARFLGCAELSPADATVDIALGDQCSALGTLTLQVDTTKVTDGPHQLTASVTDAAGNVRSQTMPLEVSNNPVTPTVTPSPTATGTPTPTPTPTPTATPTPTPTATVIPAPLGQTRPAATATPTPTPKPSRTVDLVKLPKPLKVSRSGTITVSVLCPATSAATCAPRLTLTASVPRKATIATGRGTARPGKLARITLRLSSAARRVVARKGSLSATLTLRDATPTTVRLRR